MLLLKTLILFMNASTALLLKLFDGNFFINTSLLRTSTLSELPLLETLLACIICLELLLIFCYFSSSMFYTSGFIKTRLGIRITGCNSTYQQLLFIKSPFTSRNCQWPPIGLQFFIDIEGFGFIMRAAMLRPQPLVSLMLSGRDSRSMSRLITLNAEPTAPLFIFLTTGKSAGTYITTSYIAGNLLQSNLRLTPESILCNLSRFSSSFLNNLLKCKGSFN